MTDSLALPHTGLNAPRWPLCGVGRCGQPPRSGGWQTAVDLGIQEAHSFLYPWKNSHFSEISNLSRKMITNSENWLLKWWFWDSLAFSAFPREIFPGGGGLGDISVLRTTPTAQTWPCSPIQLLPYFLIALRVIYFITSSLGGSFFFPSLFPFLFPFILYFFFFPKEGGWGGESHCQLIERHFHQVFLNYHIGSQPLLCKLY